MEGHSKNTGYKNYDKAKNHDTTSKLSFMGLLRKTRTGAHLKNLGTCSSPRLPSSFLRSRWYSSISSFFLSDSSTFPSSSILPTHKELPGGNLTDLTRNATPIAVYCFPYLWSGRNRLSVGGSSGFRSGVSSFSSMAKVEKP